MKLIHSTGAELTVRDLGPVLVRFQSDQVPLKFNGYRIVEDEEARRVVRELLDLGIYKRTL